MHKLTSFITLLAWVFMFGGYGLCLLRIGAYFLYSKLDELSDTLRGVNRTFPIKWPLLVGTLCLAWILA